jgi:hypothetical protein
MHLFTASYVLNPVYARGILYTKADAPNDTSCADWANACALQTALTKATSGDQIWVAAGMYYPGTTVSDTFTLKAEVGLYGGFAGAETTREERDWQTHLTILSGDIDQNDETNNGIVMDATDIKGANSAYIVKSSGVTVTTSLLDGFTITGATYSGLYNADSNLTLTNVTFSGNRASYGAGGGMYNIRSSAVLSNVVLRGNAATYQGGGMYNAKSDLTLINVTFDTNSFGGMVNTQSTMILTDVFFIGNAGHGMYNTQSNITIFGSSFIGNIVSGMTNVESSVLGTNTAFLGNRDGGMHNTDTTSILHNVLVSGNTQGGLVNNQSNLLLTNVTISSNDGSGLINNDTSPIVQNSILWGNTAFVINRGTSVPTFTHSIVQRSGGSLAWNGMQGIDGGNNLDVDPQFVDFVPPNRSASVMGNYRLKPTSPALDAGNNSNVVRQTDLDGVERIYHNTVDMGAYEVTLRDFIPGIAVNIIPAIDVVKVGETITYTYLVTNTGNTFLNPIVIDDSRMGRVSQVSDNFLPTTTMTNTLIATIVEEDAINPFVTTMLVTATVFPIQHKVYATASTTVTVVLPDMLGESHTTITPHNGGVMTTTHGVLVTFPPSTVDISTTTTLKRFELPLQKVPEQFLVLRSYKIEAQTDNDNPIKTLKTPAIFQIPYTAEDRARLGDLSETSLKMVFWDGTTWEKLPSAVDTTAHVVTSSFDRFGHVLLIAQPQGDIFLPYIVR